MATDKAYVEMLEAKAKAAEAKAAAAEARAAEAEAEAERAKRAQARITVKVGKSGTVSVYGLQRFPVSLHPEQWDRLLTPAVTAEIGKLTQMSRRDEAGFARLVAAAKLRAEEMAEEKR